MKPICTFCKQPGELTVVNHKGGYGEGEVLICDQCLPKPENATVKRRILDLYPGIVIKQF